MKNLIGKFHAKFAYLFFICQENFMKNLLGKFHAERLVSFFGFLSGKFHEKFVRKISCFVRIFFMKNLLGKFHAEIVMEFS